MDCYSIYSEYDQTKRNNRQWNHFACHRIIKHNPSKTVEIGTITVAGQVFLPRKCYLIIDDNNFLNVWNANVNAISDIFVLFWPSAAKQLTDVWLYTAFYELRLNYTHLSFYPKAHPIKCLYLMTNWNIFPRVNGCRPPSRWVIKLWFYLSSCTHISQIWPRTFKLNAYTSIRPTING